MKAWRVEPYKGFDWSEIDTEEAEPIVHADTRAQAIARSGLCKNGHYSYVELRATRARSFDDKPLTDRTYLENGWQCPCYGCGDVVLDSDGPVDWNDDDYDVERCVHYNAEDHAFCSEQCLREWENRRWPAGRPAEAGVGGS